MLFASAGLRPARLVVLAYDIGCPRRARGIRRVLDSLHHAKQYSVFEAMLGDAECRGVLAEISACCDFSSDLLAVWWPLDGLRLRWLQGRLTIDARAGEPCREPAALRPNIGNFMSGNLALVVDHAGATLEMGSHDTVVLVHADGRRERVGLRALGSVVLHGDVKLSTGLLQAIAAHGVALTALPVRGRTPAVGFSCMPHRHVALRHAQHLAFADPQRRLELARRAVWAKLEAMAEFARRHAPAGESDLYRAMQAAAAVSDVAALMGVEGAATVKHFAALEALYLRGGPFRFNGRSRQPPRDEPNALMSLAYTLAQGQATQLALHAGLDVQIGFLHALHRDRESLSLDLIEPARAELDDWVHGLLTDRGLLKPAMFSHCDDGAVRLTKEGRGLFYPAWYREGFRIARRPMRRLLAAMLDSLRSCLHSDPAFASAELSA
ncbi:CRISPR-associated endonuclease Cas1 [uncultured Thiodictyon sp.]|uniref:CRISPR-associated endonuclease Cas1 n=1 Tax=uncultured Thiodictyon sp. TaxID=1846217 RepID=UPI0025E50796|nr:CRISPR-associated endonuclease Cas1 [uncultured Thiodictyon sp.]